MEQTQILFYRNSINPNQIQKVVNDNSIKWIFINITEYRAQKSIFKRFIENELSSIPLFDKLIKKLYKFKNLFKKSHQTSQNINSDSIFAKKPENVEFKSLAEYITPKINENSDKYSRELYNEVKKKNILQDHFIISDFNLYEINRLEFVEVYYKSFLNILALIRLFDLENPTEVYIMPSVENTEIILIRAVAKKYELKIKQFLEKRTKKQQLIKEFKNIVRTLIEFTWYWNLWKIFNKKVINFKQFEHKKKYNFVLCHYKNFFTSLNQVLKHSDETKDFFDILYIPHKLISYTNNLIQNNRYRNVGLLSDLDKNYASYRNKYKSLKVKIFDIVNSNEFADIEFVSINLSNLIKISFLTLHEKLNNSLRYIESLQNILEKVKPDLLSMLAGNDPYGVLATQIAKKMNIPTLYYPHSIIKYQRDFDIFEQDHVVCAGNKDKEYFISLGTEPTKIKILGVPSYDEVYLKFQAFKNPKEIRKEIIKKFNLNENKKIILLVTTWDVDYKRIKVLNSVLDVYLEQSDSQLIIKIHPLEEDSFYAEKIKDIAPQKILVVKEKILHELIVASDLIIGSSSNAQIEALLLNKNVIDLCYEFTSDPHLMGKFGAVIPVYKPDELQEAVQKGLYGESISASLKKGRDKFIDYSLFKFDGKAAERVFNLIKEIVNL